MMSFLVHADDTTIYFNLEGVPIHNMITNKLSKISGVLHRLKYTYHRLITAYSYGEGI